MAENAAPSISSPGLGTLVATARGPALHPLDQVRQRLRRPILNVHVHMVFTHHSLEYAHVFCITYLDQQLAAPQLDVSLQHRVPVFCYPHQVRRQPCYRMPAVSVVAHRARLLPRS